MRNIRLIPLPLFIFSLISHHFYSYTKTTNAQNNIRHATVYEIRKEGEREASFKKASSSNYEPLITGIPLYFGDLVYSGDSRVSIKCNDDSITTLPKNAVSGVNYVCPGLSQLPRRQTNIWNILFGH